MVDSRGSGGERALVDDYTNAHLKIVKVAPFKYAIFSEAGDYLETLHYDQAKPLILKPKARAKFLDSHEVEWRNLV